MENTKCKDFILQNHLNFSISQHANEMYIHDTLLMDTFVIFSSLQVLYLVFDKDGVIDNNGRSEVPTLLPIQLNHYWNEMHLQERLLQYCCAFMVNRNIDWKRKRLP